MYEPVKFCFMVLSTKCKQQVAPPSFYMFWLIMASLKNVIGLPNLGQNCYMSSVIQLLKCCSTACDIVLNHYEACFDCAIGDWNEQSESKRKYNYMV